MITSTRIEVMRKCTPHEVSLYSSLAVKSAQLLLSNETKPCLNWKTEKNCSYVCILFCLYAILTETSAVDCYWFSRQNDVGMHASTVSQSEKLQLAVVLFSWNEALSWCYPASMRLNHKSIFHSSIGLLLIFF